MGVCTGTVEGILKQKISKSVKEHMVNRFDKNRDGSIYIDEFLTRLMPNAVSTLYSYLPGNI